MTAAEVVTVAGAIVGIIASLTALAVQTQKLIIIAEQYMTELRKQNDIQSTQVRELTAAVVGKIPTENTGKS